MTFEQLYPGVYPKCTRFEITDAAGNVIESWERDKDGTMINVTKRDHARAELVAAQEEFERLRGKINEVI